jgi:hypothetical protein
MKLLSRVVRWSPLAGALALGACAHTGPLPMSGATSAPAPDSTTVALWHMDDRAVTTVTDAGPHHLDGTAGRNTRTPYGRFGLARGFTLSLDSFIYIQYEPALDLRDNLAIDAWIDPQAIGRNEDTPIAARWTEDTSQQSWLFTLGGSAQQAPANPDPSPGLHLSLLSPVAPGHLWFLFQPEAAGSPRAFTSTRPVELNRWTHVAVTYDGEVVRFFLDGILDAQYASPGRIRNTEAPLLIGNYFDPRTLTRFGGDLSPEVPGSRTPYYAYQGMIDELRISDDPRRTFAPR